MSLVRGHAKQVADRERKSPSPSPRDIDNMTRQSYRLRETKNMERKSPSPSPRDLDQLTRQASRLREEEQRRGQADKDERLGPKSISPQNVCEADFLNMNGDLPEKAVKFTYDRETEQWVASRAYVTLSEEPFCVGSMRVGFLMTEKLPDGVRVTWVAKLFKTEQPVQAYFHKAMSQLLAKDFADEFAKQSASHARLEFIPVTIYKLCERDDQLVCVEPLIAGKFKPVTTAGDDLLEAFSHYTWSASEQRILVFGMKGVAGCYTSPRVHSADGEGFGSQNEGMESIKKFLKQHSCSDFCSAPRAADSGSDSGSDSGRGKGAEGMRKSVKFDPDTSSTSAPPPSILRKAPAAKSSSKQGLWQSGKSFAKALLDSVKVATAPSTGPKVPKAQHAASASNIRSNDSMLSRTTLPKSLSDTALDSNRSSVSPLSSSRDRGSSPMRRVSFCDV